MQVVVIDDTLITARLIGEYLKQLSDVTVHTYTDPVEGLEFCLSQDIDLVLVDYLMPDMDGMEYIKRYRAERTPEEYPVIMVTAMEDKEILREAFELGANDFVDKPVEPIELLARGKNLLALRRKSVELRELATVDSLTGVFIRRHFLEESEHEVAREQRYGGKLSVIMVDADHFKSVNDTYGHAAGDEVLRHLAKSCKDHLRDQDFVGRLGGEEFAIMLPETDLVSAQKVAERIRVNVAESVVATKDGSEIRYTVSQGVAQWHSGESLSAMMQRADAALYAAKEGGRNRVEQAAA
ncbi:diguanylate cyclase [Aestuariispira insulae]|uniref:diguanylate cyclase n=1 Tax=Aestuariispira insulae TaxID=1461337 RepID=A0A3D9HE11_9PROT|nr:diguanylate cyclase [Aestuariispira insulae]RED47712.1 response regulator receiver modulated diguanylate cyclase [Aestuariispira insulae]